MHVLFPNSNSFWLCRQTKKKKKNPRLTASLLKNRSKSKRTFTVSVPAICTMNPFGIWEIKCKVAEVSASSNCKYFV